MTIFSICVILCVHKEDSLQRISVNYLSYTLTKVQNPVELFVIHELPPYIDKLYDNSGVTSGKGEKDSFSNIHPLPISSSSMTFEDKKYMAKLGEKKTINTEYFT